MDTQALILNAPGELSVTRLGLKARRATDVLVEIDVSAVSTGTEKLLWTGEMPPFPGMGYPLVPGYEASGTVIEAGSKSGRTVGERVFVPGADCYKGARGLFGASARRIIADGSRVVPVGDMDVDESALFALAATAWHAIADGTVPDLIIGHGVLGRLLARIALLKGGNPVVWELQPDRQSGAEGYVVCSPEQDPTEKYGAIYDASGDAGLIPLLISRLKRGGEVVLAGFYSDPISFAYPPAFMAEARLRVAAEWAPQDLAATADAVRSGALSLAGLITHRCDARDAADGYATAFTDPTCLKLVIDWKDLS